MKLRIFITSLFTSLMIIGCNTNHSSPPQTRGPYANTQVLVGQCLFREGSGESAAVITALAGLAVDKAFNIVAAGLRAAGAEKNEYLSGLGNFDIPPASLPKTCVTIIQGRFYSSVSKIPDDNYFEPAWAASAGLDKEKLKILAKWHHIYFVDKPDFIMESVISETTTPGVFSIRPLYALMTRPAAKPWADYSGTRHIAVLFSFFNAGDNPESASNPGTEITLGNLTQDQPIIFHFPANGEWEKPKSEIVNNGVPQISSTPYLKWPNEGRFFKLGPAFSGPSTVKVMVTQKKSENKLMTFLADAFDSVQKDLAATTKQAIIPSAALDAKLAVQKDDLAKLTTYTTTYNSALAALEKCANGNANVSSNAEILVALQLAQAAQLAQKSANLSAKANNYVEPFTASQIIAASGKSARAECEKVLTSKLTNPNILPALQSDPALPPG